MVMPYSTRDVAKNRHGVPSFSRSFLFFVLRHFILIAVFIAGIMVGLTLDKDISSYYTTTPTQLRQLEINEISATTAPPTLQSMLLNPRTTKDVDGWKTIEIFYGSTKHVESLLPSNQKFYSQARQDEVVLSLLKNKTNGYFVDLAANDATFLSNSYALEKYYGWKGLCIEPNPVYWYNLTHTRRNCELVGAVIGQTRMDQVDFKFDGLEHGGIVGAGFDNGPHLKHSSNKEYTVTLLEIFKKFDVPKVIDYLSLDVEGAEELIMNEFPLIDYRIRILTIERPKENLRTYLERHGYSEILRLSRWGETLWIHGSFEADMDMTHLQDFHGKKQYEEQKARQQLNSTTKGPAVLKESSMS